MRDSRYLFVVHDLRGVLENQFLAMEKEVDSIKEDKLLNTSVSDMIDYLEEKYKVEFLELDIKGITVDQKEIEVDVSQDHNRYISDRSRSFYVKGTSNIFYIPFSGDEILFKCRPSTFTHSPPMGVVTGSELVLTYRTTGSDPEVVRKEFDRDIGEINRYLGWIKADVTAFNSTIRDKANQIVNQRRERILSNRGLVASLGFPMRERQYSPKTYSVPDVKRKPPIRPPFSSSEPFKPEPALENEEYEHILRVMDNMVAVMERSPHAFAGMGEEDIRQHFLVQLKGQYEGQATGETFNYEGKTDILIRANGKNIFIAECKFWRGQKVFLDTIDQILAYLSWRDTKTAILLFNRNKNSSAVREKIPSIIKEHSNFKRFVDYQREAGWRAILSQRDDVNRELTLTIHLYDVPGKE